MDFLLLIDVGDAADLLEAMPDVARIKCLRSLPVPVQALPAHNS